MGRRRVGSSIVLLAEHTRPEQVTTDKAKALIGAVKGLLPYGAHDTSAYANDRVECDHDQLKARLRPKRGLQTRSHGIGGDPTIVCLQAGNVNTGACDPLATAAAVARDHGAWVHVDGAFGLWAAANPATRYLMDGIEMADSWAVDGHKWLNVPYDTGYVFCAHADAHAAALIHSAAYLTGQGQGGLRSPGDFVMESSRRARGFATWAALRQLGRRGVADLVERCCVLARRFATQLESIDGVTVMNDVVLNRVLVRFGDDDRTDQVVEHVQRSGECWMGATTWHGQRLMRISVSNWSTTEADVDRSPLPSEMPNSTTPPDVNVASARVS